MGKMDLNSVLALGCVILCLPACSDKPSNPDLSNSNTFTLASRVVLSKVEDCDDRAESHGSLRVSKSGSTYLVKTNAMFFCGSEMESPYLTLPINGKATLVLDSKANRGGCECYRSVEIQITDRLASGQTLYVLNNGEVLDHAVLP